MRLKVPSRNQVPRRIQDGRQVQIKQAQANEVQLVRVGQRLQFGLLFREDFAQLKYWGGATQKWHQSKLISRRKAEQEFGKGKPRTRLAVLIRNRGRRFV